MRRKTVILVEEQIVEYYALLIFVFQLFTKINSGALHTIDSSF